MYDQGAQLGNIKISKMLNCHLSPDWLDHDGELIGYSTST